MMPGVFLHAAFGTGLLACGAAATIAAHAAAHDPHAGKDTSACGSAPATGSTRFKGGTASGEEITVHVDHATASYRIVIDASGIASRRGAVRSGSLQRDGGDCAYRMSGENGTPMGFGAHGVLLGRLAPAKTGAAPVAFIAFRDTSNRLADLAGYWRVSGREVAIDAALPSRPIAGYELRVLPDGSFGKCAIPAPGRKPRCFSDGGRFRVHDAVFRLHEGAGSDASLILGRVGDRFVPILLKRDAGSQGLRIFTARANGTR